MSSFSLTAQTPLAGHRLDLPGLSFEEVTDRALVSVAAPRDGIRALADAVTAAFGAALPTAGQSTISTDGGTRLLALSSDQFLVMCDDRGGDPTASMRDDLGSTAYIVDQSDSWAIASLSGSNSRTALERICMLDLAPASFGPGCVARTVVEHLAIIIVCISEDGFILMSPRSSASSFAHAIETSAHNVS